MRNLTTPMVLGAALALLGGAASAQPVGPSAPFPGPGMAAATGAATRLAADCPDAPGVFTGHGMDPANTALPKPPAGLHADANR